MLRVRWRAGGRAAGVVIVGTCVVIIEPRCGEFLVVPIAAATGSQCAVHAPDHGRQRGLDYMPLDGSLNTCQMTAWGNMCGIQGYCWALHVSIYGRLMVR
jgi:hypothetical protein